MKRISKITAGNFGEVSVCEVQGKRYLMWEVQDVKTACYLLEVKEQMPYTDCFVPGECLCILLRYEKCRPFLRYMNTQPRDKVRRRKMCLELVYLCLAEELPWPILYLIVKQRQINMDKEGKLYFTYELNLDELDQDAQEPDCVREVGYIIQEMLREKKILAEGCDSFTELYQSLKIPKRRKRKIRISPSAAKKVFYVLCALAAVLLVTVIVVAVSQAVFGEVPLFRIFTNPFREIGTEILGP